MKKRIIALISFILAAAMMFGLTGCSIDINPDDGGETIHIDLSSLEEYLDLEDAEIALEEIQSQLEEGAMAAAYILAEASTYLSDKGKAAVYQLFEELLSQAGIDQETLEEVLGESLGASAGDSAGYSTGDSAGYSASDAVSEQEEAEIIIPEDLQEVIDTEDLQEASEETQDYEETLAILKEVLEANGYGAYYDILANVIQNNPEMLEEYMETGSISDLYQLFMTQDSPVQEAAPSLINEGSGHDSGLDIKE